MSISSNRPTKKLLCRFIIVYFARPGSSPSPVMVSALSLSMAAVNTSWALPVSSIRWPPSTFSPMASVQGRSASDASASPCSVVLPI